MQSSSAPVVQYRIDFLKYRYVWLAVSIAYFVIGLIAYVMNDGFRYHIDFSGGTEVRLSFEKSLDIGTLRNAMVTNGWPEAVIQSVGTTNKDFLVVISSMEDDTEAKMLEALRTTVSGNKASVDNIQVVGPEAGKDTTKNAILGIVLSLLLLLLYIAVRFDFRFGIGAIVCLLHDVLAVMVFLLLTKEPISLHILASVLAVIGYSLNDIIVVFSRIRENFNKLKGVSEYDIANLSINQTLSRTILTSFATTLSVAAILVLGGETLRGLSLVMLIGIIVGTYSSIYIASPVMLAVKSRKNA